MNLIDTHCHIHEAQYDLVGDHGVRDKWVKAGSPTVDAMIEEANAAGVSGMICVGTTAADSELAITCAQHRKNVWASIGIHPHEAKEHLSEKSNLQQFRNLASEQKVAAVGECGLDYFYEHSPKADQIAMLEMQLQLAIDNKLPVIFHVREAFDDFWPIFNNFPGLHGVLHSYTDSVNHMKIAVRKGLYIGLNGIMTFTKNPDQLEMARSVPLENLVLETDAPFLTPTPERGKICQPKHVVLTAEFLAELRDENLDVIAAATSKNAQHLFRINVQ